jgi:hypothetical protein
MALGDHAGVMAGFLASGQPEPGPAINAHTAAVPYRDHPRHREIVAKYIAPIRAAGAAVQYEL